MPCSKKASLPTACPKNRINLLNQDYVQDNKNLITSSILLTIHI